MQVDSYERVTFSLVEIYERVGKSVISVGERAQRAEQMNSMALQSRGNVTDSYLNKNALSSVESRVFVDTISSEEANRALAFVIRRGGASAYKRAGDARRLA